MSDYEGMLKKAFEKGRQHEKNQYKDDIYLGIERGKGRGVYLSDEVRSTHMHVIGATGTGKTKFLEHLIRQDILKGNGLCLIDPHGDLYRAIMRFCADNQLEQKVIPFNPADPEFSVGFNPVKRQAMDISYQVGRLCDACLKAWKQEDSVDTPRLRRWLYRVFYTLAEKDLTLVEAGYLTKLYKSGIRKKLTETLTENEVREDFEWLEGLKGMAAERMIQEQLESVKNKIDSFINSRVVRRIFGQQRHTLNFRKMIDQGSILLVNLSEQETLSSDQVDLIGILFVNELIAAGKSRHDIPEDKRRPFYLYIDEFSQFVTRDIARALAEMRKFGLHLILAHQNLGQLSTDDPYIFNSVMTNARTKVVFGGLYVNDAEMMAKEIFYGELDPDQIKLELKRTYFEPSESTRVVVAHSHSTSRGKSSTETSGTSYGTSDSSGYNSSSGETFAGEQIFPDRLSTTDSSAFSRSSGRSQSSSSSSSSGETESETDGYTETVVPWIEHIKRQETSSIQFRSVEEQLYIKTALLKGQETRNALIKMPDTAVKNIKIPFVPNTYAGENTEEYFKNTAYEKNKILRIQEVDKEIDERQKYIKGSDLKQTIKSIPDEPESFKGRPSKLPS